MKSWCPDKLIMGHFNIYSILNTFDALSHIFDNADILIITKTKLHPIGLTEIQQVVILLYVLEIPSRLLNSKSKITTSAKINFRKNKWFLNCSYNPNKNLIANHLKGVNRTMNEINSNYNLTSLRDGVLLFSE